MGSIQIFSLEFSGTRFACARDFTGAYRLEAGDFVVTLTSDGAGALAEGGGRIRLRAQIASRFGKEMKSGPTYRRDMLAVDGRVAHIEIGVADSGDSIFLEIGTARMTLTDQQAQLLLAVLDQLGRDVTVLYRATAVQEDDMSMGIAPGLRGFAYPWETDPTW